PCQPLAAPADTGAESEQFQRCERVFAGVASDLQLTVGRRHVLFLEDLQQGAGGAGACGASGVGVDAYADQPFGLWLAVLGATGQGSGHELGPDRQGGGAAVFPSTQWSGLVETDPDGGDVVAVVAGEPAVLLIVGGTGLAGQVAALQLPGAGGSAPGDHILKHAVELVDGPRVDDLLCGLHLG